MNTTKRYKYNSTLGNQYAGYRPKKHIKLLSIMHVGYEVQGAQL